MQNIFETINAKIPKITPVQADTADKETIDVIIDRWKANGNRADASKILKFLNPTIHSAINTYAAGSEDKVKIRAASLALDAIRNYDPARGVSPQTFVFHNLKRLSRVSADRANIVKIPEEQRLQYRMLVDAEARFEDDHGREPSTAELADLTGLTEKRIDTIKSNNAVINESTTLNPETGDTTFGVSGMSDMDYLSYVYAGSGPTDQKIIEWTSGLHGKPLLGTNEIASKLNISPAAVSQRKAKLLNQLSEMRSLL